MFKNKALKREVRAHYNYTTSSLQGESTKEILAVPNTIFANIPISANARTAELFKKY